MLKKTVPFEKRVINVGWRHKSSVTDEYFHLGSRLAPTLKIKSLSESIPKIYVQVIITKYVDSSNNTSTDTEYKHFDDKEPSCSSVKIDQKKKYENNRSEKLLQDISNHDLSDNILNNDLPKNYCNESQTLNSFLDQFVFILEE
ncbi:hypothetical protein TSAR_013812 [Trichomalopsis sarcophagae]|uniref:Uncharacterized protein n=1 Tax=Trichomalopsis sarcophagae TaxID=543379 RepID=A0A232ET66_9HYME|nr:hypothetical protein TSAR_013812 [Trichomalopsis sarcophagae]